MLARPEGLGALTPGPCCKPVYRFNAVDPRAYVCGRKIQVKGHFFLYSFFYYHGSPDLTPHTKDNVSPSLPPPARHPDRVVAGGRLDGGAACCYPASIIPDAMVHCM